MDNHTMNTDTNTRLTFGEIDQERLEWLSNHLNRIGGHIELNGRKPTIALLLEVAVLIGLQHEAEVLKATKDVLEGESGEGEA
jgi:hypothetical protein